MRFTPAAVVTRRISGTLRCAPGALHEQVQRFGASERLAPRLSGRSRSARWWRTPSGTTTGRRARDTAVAAAPDAARIDKSL